MYNLGSHFPFDKNTCNTVEQMKVEGFSMKEEVKCPIKTPRSCMLHHLLEVLCQDAIFTFTHLSTCYLTVCYTSCKQS